ncbi:MAG TPA: peptidyl-prolyl cis-trans isomerase [Thiobacillaceae bacterium]|nr:peptidyl-prolyl cis-trans isomerase [Thiobacillaceae bacterium]
MNQTYKLLLLAAAVSLLVPACSDKKPSAAEQAAVRVNGEPIMAADFGIKSDLTGAGQMSPVSASDMKLMVDLELMRQAAVASKLDQDKEVHAKLADSPKELPRKILALAYINKQLSSIPAPTDAEVTAFYNSNPAKFAERKRYDLQACVIKPTNGKEAKIKAQLSKSKKYDDFERWLKANRMKHASLPVSVISDHADGRLLQKLSNVPVGGSVVEDGKDQMTITFIRAMQNDPLTLDQAKPQIMTMLKDKKRSEGYANMIKQLRDKAKIEYVPPYTEKGLQPSLSPSVSNRNDQYTTA